MKKMVMSLVMLLAAAGLPLSAAEIIKANNADPLNAGSSWTGGTAPSAADEAVWNSTVTGANSSALTNAVIWNGIKVTNPGGAVTIAGSGLLTLDGGAAMDINMAAAAQNLTIEAPLSLLSNLQEMDILSSRTLRLAGPVSLDVSGSWARKGSGTMILDGPVTSAVNTTLELQKGTTVLTGAGGGLNFPATGGRLYVGRYDGGDAILIISNGVHATGSTSAEASANFVGVGARGRLFMEGGTLSVKYLRCGINGGSTFPSEIRINNGLLDATGGGSSGLSSYALMLGNNHQDSTSATSASGILTVNGGQAVFTNGVIKLGSESSTSTGAQAVNLNGGELVVRQFYVGASVLVPKTVTLNGGLLRVTAAGDLFTGAGAGNGTLSVNVGDKGAFVHTDTGAVTLAPPLLGAGSGGLMKLGSGTLLLTGASSYTGKTLVLGGTLGFGGAAAALTPDLAVVSGAGLTLRDGALTVFAPVALSIGGASSSSLELELAADGLANDVLALPAGAAVGALAVSAVIQGTTSPVLLAGDYDIMTYAGPAPDVSRFTIANQAPGRTYEFILNAGPQTVTLRIGYGTAESLWIAPGSGGWETAANWSTLPVNGSGTLTRFNEMTTVPATVTAASPVTVGGMTFDSALSYTLAGGGYTLDNGSSPAYINVESGAHAVSGGVTLSGALELSVLNGTQLTLDGVVDGGGQLVKNGAGELWLGGVNAYSGGSRLKSGSVILNNGGTVGSGPVSAEGASGFRITGATPAVFSNDLTIVNSFVFNTFEADLSLRGAVDWQSTSRVLTKSGPFDLSLDVDINETGDGRFRVDQGTLRFRNGHSYYVAQSERDTIQMVNNNNSSRTVMVEEGATVDISGIYMEYGMTNRVVVEGGALNLRGGGSSQDVCLLRANGAGYDEFVVNGGQVTAGAATWFNIGIRGGSAALGALVINGGTTTLGRVSMGVRAESTAFGGNGRVVLNGGLLEVAGVFNWMADSQSGRTNVVTLGSGAPGVGTLRLPATISTAYGAVNQAIMIFNGGTLETTGVAAFGSSSLADYLYGAKLVYVAEGGARIDTRALAITIKQDLNSGSVADGGLTKLGAGVLTLTGACGFSGPVTVDQGALVLPATVASTGVVVAAGAELVLANGTIQTLALNQAALASGSKLTFEALADGSACDRIDLPDGAAVGDLSIAVVKQGTALTVTAPGDYVIFTFAGSAPVISGWTLRNPPGGRTATFVIDGTSVLLRIAYEAGAAIWTTDGSGAWENAGNWTTPPGNTAGAVVFLDDAITSPATVTLAGGSTLGYLGFNNPLPYTVAGAALALENTNALDAVVAAASGVHTISAAVSAAGNLTVQAGAAAGVVADGGISAAGTLTLEGPGSLAVTDSSALAVNDLALSGGGNLMVSNSTLFTLPIALGTGGGLFTPGDDRVMDLQGVVSGSGALTKAGSGFLMLTNANAIYSGAATVKGGTLRMDTLPAGGFGLGLGTLHTIGAPGTTSGGYTLDTGDPARAAVLRTDNDITLQGPVNALSGALVKTGAGSVTFTATGENLFSADNGAGSSQGVLDIGANGDSPTAGFGGFSIADGKVVLGGAGQTNRFRGPVVVGLNSTTNADAETAGTLEISGGVTTLESDLIIGQSNGNTNTAPVARTSKLHMTGGELSVRALIMGRAAVAAAHNAAPQLEVSGGVLTVNGDGYIAEQTGSVATVTLSGGKLDYLAGSGVSLRLGQRGEANVTVSGTAELVSGLSIYLGFDPGSKATLQLDGGTVTARNLDSGGSAQGDVIFNGGTLRPTQNNNLLATLSSATVSAGGAVLDISLVGGSTLKKTLRHDTALGGADGGLTKTGAGTLTIGTAQAYDGPTVVAEGALVLPGSGLLSNVTALAVSPGAALQLNAAAVQSLALSGLTLGAPAAAPVNLTLSFTADGSAHDTLAVNGPATLGAVALTLKSAGLPDDFARNGTYSLITYTGADPAVTGMSVANPLYGKQYAFAANAGAVTLTIASDTTGAAYLWTAPGGGTWENASNWALAPGAGGAGQPVRFDDAALAPAAVTVATAATLGRVYFNNVNGYTLSGTTPVSLDNGSGTQAVVAVEAGAHTLALPVDVAAGGVAVQTAAGADLRLAAQLSGSGALVKSGAGSLTVASGSSRSGITEVLQGALVVDGAGSTGTGELVLDGGSGISAGSIGPGSLANRVILKSGAPVIDTAANDLTLAGPLDWQGTVPYLYKTGTNTLTLSGTGSGVAAMNPRLMLREGGLRFAAGADYVLDGQTRESLKLGFDAGKTTAAVVEEGATLVLGGISMTASSSGIANNTSVMTQAGGRVELRNTTGDSGNAFFLRELGTAPATYVMNGGTFDMPQSAWANSGLYGPAYLVVNGGSMTLGRFAAGYQTRTTAVGKAPVAVTVNGGRLAAAGSWSWMSDGNARTTVATVNGGVLALPATQIYGVNTANWTDLKLNGGTLEAAGAALDSSVTADWLKGARRIALGAQGGTFDTRGFDMGVVQSVQALSNTGGLAKVGAGTLTLAGTNVLWGLADAREGVLRARLAHTDLPGTPLFWLRMDDGAWSADSSGHALSVITDGSGFSAYADRNATLNALDFNGSGNLRVMHNALYPETTAFTVAAWIHVSAFVGSTQSILSGRHNADRTFEFKLNDGGELRLLEHSTGAWWQDIRTVKKVVLNQWTHVAAVISPAGTQLYINGVPEVMKASLNGPLVDYSGVGWPYPGDIRLVPAASTYGLLVGRSTTTAVRFAGRLDDVMLFDRLLSGAEVAQLAVESTLQPLSVRAASTGILDLMDLPVAAYEVSGSGQILGDLTVVGGLAAGDSAAEPAGAELRVEDLTLGTNVVYACARQGGVNDLIHVAGQLTVDGAGVIDFGHTAANPIVSSFTATVMTYDTIAGDANFADWSVTGLGRTGYDASVEAVDGEVIVSVVSLWGTLIILR